MAALDGGPDRHEQQPLAGREDDGGDDRASRRPAYDGQPRHRVQVEPRELPRQAAFARGGVDEPRRDEEAAVEGVERGQHGHREHPQLADGAQRRRAEQQLGVGAGVEHRVRHQVRQGEAKSVADDPDQHAAR